MLRATTHCTHLQSCNQSSDKKATRIGMAKDNQSKVLFKIGHKKGIIFLENDTFYFLYVLLIFVGKILVDFADKLITIHTMNHRGLF